MTKSPTVSVASTTFISRYVQSCSPIRSQFTLLCGTYEHIFRSKHTLPDLPYDFSALEPVISAEIMQIHHTKHHQVSLIYVTYIMQTNLTKFFVAENLTKLISEVVVKPKLFRFGFGRKFRPVSVSAFRFSPFSVFRPKHYFQPKHPVSAKIPYFGRFWTHISV